MATYLATVQIGRYDGARDRRRRRCRCAPSLPGAAAARRSTHDFGRQPEMMDALRAAVRALPVRRATPSWSPTTTSRSRWRRRGCRSFGAQLPGRTTWDAERLVAHELAHQWFGNSLTARPLAGHLAARGVRLLRRVAVVRGVRRPTGRRARAREHWRAARATSPQDLVLGDPGPELMFDDRRLQARRADPARAAADRRRRRVLRHPRGPGRRRTPTARVDTDDFVEIAAGHSRHALRELFHAWLCRAPLPDLPELSGSRSWRPPRLGPRS